jgi:hypothetical protein
LAAGDLQLHVTWVVLAAAGVREREAVSSAAAFLKDVKDVKDVKEITLVLMGSGTSSSPGGGPR